MTNHACLRAHLSRETNFNETNTHWQKLSINQTLLIFLWLYLALLREIEEEKCAVTTEKLWKTIRENSIWCL